MDTTAEVALSPLAPGAVSDLGHRLPLVVVVIPARNESTRLRAVLREIPATIPGVARVTRLVVDDGSTDGTAAAARAEGAIVLRQRVNLGKGGALLTGCDAAERLHADVIVAMDADGQHRPEELPKLIAPILDGSTDVVLGARTFEGEMPTLFRVGNRVLNRCVSTLFGVNVSDTQCGYRAFRGDAYPKLRWSSRDYAVESEMLVRIARQRLRFQEMPIATVYLDRFKGTQPSDGFKILRQLLLWRLGG